MLPASLVTAKDQDSWRSPVQHEAWALYPCGGVQFRLEVTRKRLAWAMLQGTRSLGASSLGDPEHTRLGTLSFVFLNWSSELRLEVEKQDCKMLPWPQTQGTGIGDGAGVGVIK